MSQPIVSFDGLEYTVSLFRLWLTSHGERQREDKYTFGEHKLSVCAAPESELASWERSQIKGPVADDGMLYYLCAQYTDVARPSLVWLKDKQEAEALREAIREAEREHYEYYRQDIKCTFCGAMESECGGDHGDEMRDIQRQALRRDY